MAVAPDTRAYVVGSTYRMNPNGTDNATAVTKDGDTWDLSNATVTLCLSAPAVNATKEHPGGGTEYTYTATISNGPGGLAYYDWTVPDEPGWWAMSWLIEDGTVIQETERQALEVQDSPGY